MAITSNAFHAPLILISFRNISGLVRQELLIEPYRPPRTIVSLLLCFLMILLAVVSIRE